MIKRGKIYSFTNENVFSYQSLYSFSNANVLSVLGSGDQYFSSLLYDAKCIEVFDVNPLAWDFFVLKFYGIKTLSFEEFYEYFVEMRMNSWNYFERLCKYMPSDVSKRLSILYSKESFLSYFIREDSGYNLVNHIIPYFNKEEYYRLQTLLRNRNLPTFYLEDFIDLPSKLSNKKYDIILASNVSHYLYLDNEIEKIDEYKELLTHFNCPEIQATYCYGQNRDENKVNAYYEKGFDIDYVYPARNWQKSSDYVISLRRK